MRLKAIIFDIDGTIAETEEAHRTAFNQAFAEAGHDWVWTPDLYRRLLKVTGGRERLRSYLGSIGTMIPAHALDQIHRRKNAIYADLVAAGEVALRPGIGRLIDKARTADVRLGIATTTSRPNVEALLTRHFGGAAIKGFDAVVTGEQVAAKKPDPEVYERALAALTVPALACVAIEDSRAGLDAALACSIAVVVTPSHYTSDEMFDGAALICADLDGPPRIGLESLERLVGAPAA